MAFWATLGSCLVQLVAPEAGGSGSAENKGPLEGWWGWVGMVHCRYRVTYRYPVKVAKKGIFVYLMDVSLTFRMFLPKKLVKQLSLVL